MKKVYKNRHIENKIKMLLANFPVIVIAGARQVGKSTLLTHLFPDYKRVIFDPNIDVEGARNDPELFLSNNPKPIILDEIQYVPELISAIKRELDINRKNGQYLITGSQQWELFKNLRESLVGRVAFIDLYPFSQSEIIEKPTNIWLKDILDNGVQQIKTSNLARNQTLFEQIWMGYYPEVSFLAVDAVPYFFQGYERTYIDRDIRLMLGKTSMEQFLRFYRLCAALTAQEINYSQIGRELGLSPDTSRRWLSMLKTTFQWIEVPAFSKNAIKRLSKKVKGYIVDSGLCCYALGISSPEFLSSHPNWGNIFESVVVMELIKQIQVFPLKPNLYHYRTLAGAEVDLIIEYNGKYYPIEIKGKTNPSKKDLSGIESFKKTFPSLEIGFNMIICAGQDSYKLKDDTWVIPF